MFKRRQPELNSPSGGQDADLPEGDEAKLPLRSGGEASPGRIQARRATDPLAGARRENRERTGASAATPAAPSSAENEGRKLVVGQGIRLSGEIKKCEKLVVEGEVQANLKDCLTLEIAETGLFNGAAVVDEAEISGVFEGELTANTRLYVRSTGRILGTIRYADLEIERGGKIAGTVDVMEAEEAAGHTATAQEDEDEPVVEAVDDGEVLDDSPRPNGANGASGRREGSDLRA